MLVGSLSGEKPQIKSHSQLHLTLRIVRTACVWTPVKQALRRGCLERGEECRLHRVGPEWNQHPLKWAIREQEELEDPACEDWGVRVSTYDTAEEIKFNSWILLVLRFYLIQNIRAILLCVCVLYLIK